MYAKTHGNFYPGEQKDRGYQWPVNKTAHRFGYGEKIELKGAEKAIQPERVETSFPKTVIVKKAVEDFKAVTGEPLGKPKNLGQGPLPVPKDFVFGVKSLPDPKDNWNAAKCITGEPTKATL